MSETNDIEGRLALDQIRKMLGNRGFVRRISTSLFESYRDCCLNLQPVPHYIGPNMHVMFGLTDAALVLSTFWFQGRLLTAEQLRRVEERASDRMQQDVVTQINGMASDEEVDTLIAMFDRQWVMMFGNRNLSAPAH